MTGAAREPALLLATRNRKKLAELLRILEASRVDVPLADLSGYPDMPEVVESGATFEENALLKARATVEYTGLPAVAEDSGLCVDALNGMPGVLSARWSGGHGDDGNLKLVLAQLADVPSKRRGAHFECAATLVLPSGAEHTTEGSVFGTITTEPRGSNGFGYDPIFLPDGYRLTTAEMSERDKDAISHRGRALRHLAPIIAARLGG